VGVGGGGDGDETGAWTDETGEGGGTLGADATGDPEAGLEFVLPVPGLEAWDDAAVPAALVEATELAGPGGRDLWIGARAGAGLDATTPRCGPLDLGSGAGPKAETITGRAE
jgi:hypothetical protein